MRNLFYKSFKQSLIAQRVNYYRLGYMLYNKDKTIQENLDGHKRSIEKLGEINRKYGILGCYHNHPGDRVGSPLWDLHWLLKDSNPDNIGVQYDICQAVMEGSESWPLAMKLLYPWIKTTAVHYEYDLGGAENGSNNPTKSLSKILVHLQNDLSWLKNKLNELEIL